VLQFFFNPIQILTVGKKYSQEFEKQKFDVSLILYLNEHDLKGVGMPPGHVKMLLLNIEKMKGGSGTGSGGLPGPFTSGTPNLDQLVNAKYLVETTNEAVETNPSNLDPRNDSTVVTFCKLFRIERALRYFKRRSERAQALGIPSVELKIVYLDAKGYDVVYEDEKVTQPFDLFFVPFFLRK